MQIVVSNKEKYKFISRHKTRHKHALLNQLELRPVYTVSQDMHV